MQSQWYIVENGSEFGPFTSDQLKQLAASSRIRPDTLLREGDSNSPISAATIDGLFPKPPSPPPLPVRPMDATVVEPVPDLYNKIPEAYRPFVALGIVAAGLIFFCCGGCCVVGSILPTPPGSTSFGARKVYENDREFKQLVLDKTQDEVIAAVGKPDMVLGRGQFTNGQMYQESWIYHECIQHKTGKKRGMHVYFVGDTVYAAMVE